MANKIAHILLVLIVLLLFPIAFADFDSSLYGYEDLYLDLDVDSSINLVKTENNYILNYVEAELVFYPAETYRQSVVSFDTDPDADIVDSNVVFRWENPSLGILDYGLEAEVHTENKFFEVTDKVYFPVLDVPYEYEQYLQQTDLIDIDTSIEAIAVGLAEGENDAYVVTWKIADWVKTNVEYDLNTITAEASLPSSWVLRERQGVCDEITNLFISMLRSVGIPARFVTGMAFTTSEMFTEQFGPHGWAEVYFPDHGWVPFDVTYGQYGFLDATHIKFKDSIDSNRSSVKYEWESYGVQVSPQPLETTAGVSKTGGLAVLPFEFDAEVLYQEVSFGSYNLIETQVENTNGYYVPVILYLSKSSGYEAIGGYERSALLAPGEETTLLWMIQVDPQLDRDYEYFFEGTVYAVTNESSFFSFSSKQTDPDYSFSFVEGIMEDREQETQMVYSKEIELSCTIEDNEFYAEFASDIKCTIQNTGNTVQRDVEVCYETHCEEMDLGIADSEDIEFSIKDLDIGTRTAKITAENKDMFKSASLYYTVLDQPKIIIQEIAYIEEVELNQRFNLSFLLDRDSLDIPRNVDVHVEYGKTVQTVFKEALEEDTYIAVDILTNDLLKEESSVVISVYYEDENGNSFSDKDDISIRLINLGFWDKVKLFLRRLF